MVIRSSMLYWWPKVQDLNIPMPKTVIPVEMSFWDWLKPLDGEHLPNDALGIITEAADNLGYPLFMRSDLTSSKHDYENTCFVNNKDSLVGNLVNLIDNNAAYDLPMQAIVLREFIELEYLFKAFHGLPIAKERRYFVQDGEVLIHHPYWPDDAMQFRGYLVPNEWRAKLHDLNTETEEEVELLSGYAEQISSRLDDAWSVDFAKGTDGKWYFIDAAVAHESWVDDKYIDKLHEMISKSGP